MKRSNGSGRTTAAVRAGLSPVALRRLALSVLIIVVVATRADAIRAQYNYPKVGLITAKVGEMSQSQIDTLSWYDYVALSDYPETLELIREHNPNIKLYYFWMPQNIINWSENDTFWYPDTSWSLARLSQFYALRNDWYLRKTNGERIAEWDGWHSNWTRYCPKGTYGTSRGLNYVEWLTHVAIPRMVNGEMGLPPWGPHGGGSYNGFMFEVLVDCVGSWANEEYFEADPDLDGEAEGCYSTCTMGGDRDSLSILMREMNEVFHEVMSSVQDQGIEVIFSPGNIHMGPSYRTDFTGAKLEGWMSWYHQSWQDWRDWFYGLQDRYETTVWGPGYYWAERYMGHTGVDSLEGWDNTILEVWPRPGLNEATCQRLKRWGLGTALLGEGYFAYTRDQHGLFWQPEYEWDFGRPLGGYFHQTYPNFGRPDTLFVRHFSRGYVKVNPEDHDVGGVPAQDAIFGWWGRIKNLLTSDRSDGGITVSFETPVDPPSPIDGYEIRYADFPLNEESWERAALYSGGLVTAEPGGRVEIALTGLPGARAWEIGVRGRVGGELEPLGDQVSVFRPQGLAMEAKGNTAPAPIEEREEEDALAAGAAWRVELPNPYGRGSTIRLAAPAGTPIVAEIYSLEGRLVRRLYQAIAPASGANVSWDGRTNSGELAGSGVYWLNLRGEETSVRKRLLLVQ